MIKISIITVCLNDIEGLKRTIESVLEQKVNEIEHIIVDGGSDDGTGAYLDILIENGSIIGISEKDCGIYDAMNKGLRIAQGKWVYFLNAGDYLVPGALAKILENLNYDVEAIYGNVFLSMRYNNNIFYLHEYGDTQIDNIRKKMICSHQGILFNRKYIIEIGSYDASFRVAGDWDLIARIYALGGHFKYIDMDFAVFDQSGISSKPHLSENHRVRKNNFLYRGIDLWLIKDLLHDIKSILLNTFLGEKKKALSIKTKGYSETLEK